MEMAIARYFEFVRSNGVPAQLSAGGRHRPFEVTPTFVAASTTDLGEIYAVLSASDLPTGDVDQHIRHFLLAKQGGHTIGTVAIEYGVGAALLRSLCVVPEHRGRQLGAHLLSAIEAEAASRGVRDLFLLTTSSMAFFERHGFSRTSRAAAPPSIQATAQFRTLCPSSAVCMHKSMSARSGEGITPR